MPIDIVRYLTAQITRLRLPPGTEIVSTTTVTATEDDCCRVPCCEDVDGGLCAAGYVFPQVLYCHVDYFLFDFGGAGSAPTPESEAWFDQWFPMYYQPRPYWLTADRWNCTENDGIAFPAAVGAGGSILYRSQSQLSILLSFEAGSPAMEQPLNCFSVFLNTHLGHGGLSTDDLELQIVDSSLDPFYLHFQDETSPGVFFDLYISE